MTEEKYRALMEERDRIMKQVDEMEQTTPEDIWRKDIKHFLEELDINEEEEAERERLANEKGRKNKRGGALKRKQSAKPRAKKQQQKQQQPKATSPP